MALAVLGLLFISGAQPRDAGLEFLVYLFVDRIIAGK